MEFLRLLRFSKAAELMGVTSPQAREAKKATVGFVIAGVLLGFLLAPEGQIEKWNRGLDQIDKIMAAKEEEPTTSMDQDPFKAGQEMAQGLIGAMADEEQLAQARSELEGKIFEQRLIQAVVFALVLAVSGIGGMYLSLYLAGRFLDSETGRLATQVGHS